MDIFSKLLSSRLLMFYLIIRSKTSIVSFISFVLIWFPVMAHSREYTVEAMGMVGIAIAASAAGMTILAPIAAGGALVFVAMSLI